VIHILCGSKFISGFRKLFSETKRLLSKKEMQTQKNGLKMNIFDKSERELI